MGQEVQMRVPGCASATAAYSQSGGAISKTDQTYSASKEDKSTILVTDGGSFTLTNSLITSSGNTSSRITVVFMVSMLASWQPPAAQSILPTVPSPLPGLARTVPFQPAVDHQSTLPMSPLMQPPADAHAVMATQGGTMTINNVNMTTSGGSSSPIATDRGGGMITVTGGTVTTSGNNSAGIYSTGNIMVSEWHIYFKWSGSSRDQRSQLHHSYKLQPYIQLRWEMGSHDLPEHVRGCTGNWRRDFCDDWWIARICCL